MKQISSELIIEAIKFLLVFFSSLLAAIIANRDYQNRKIEEAKERSVGAQALIILRKEIDELKVELIISKNSDEHLKNIIARLEDDYDTLMKRFFEYFKPAEMK